MLGLLVNKHSARPTYKNERNGSSSQKTVLVEKHGVSGRFNGKCLSFPLRYI